MKRLFQWIVRRVMGQPSPAVPLPVAVMTAPDWLPQHQTTLARFLESEPGRVLWARYQAVRNQVALQACADPFNTSHAAGTAHGWDEAGQWLLSLSRSSRAIEEKPDSPPPGEAELAERFSP